MDTRQHFIVKNSCIPERLLTTKVVSYETPWEHTFATSTHIYFLFLCSFSQRMPNTNRRAPFAQFSYAVQGKENWRSLIVFDNSLLLAGRLSSSWTVCWSSNQKKESPAMPLFMLRQVQSVTYNRSSNNSAYWYLNTGCTIILPLELMHFSLISMLFESIVYIQRIKQDSHNASKKTNTKM